VGALHNIFGDLIIILPGLIIYPIWQHVTTGSWYIWIQPTAKHIWQPNEAIFPQR
jgi:hypothetical protein